MAGCLAIATCEAEDTESADAVAAALDRVFVAHGAKSDRPRPALSWKRGSFSSPAMRDTLLDLGVLAETVETAKTWKNLAVLKQAVTDALRNSLTHDGAKPVALCHISHVYPAGGSLYFRGVASLTADPLGQLSKAKEAASRAIVDSGGTITHHHEIGRDHRRHLHHEIGGLGVDLLRAVKQAVDPAGIMNPGVLVPDETARDA